MSDASASAGPAASAVAASPASAQAEQANAAPAQTAEDLIDLELEPGKPVKVPRSKLDPHLAKYRSETDKLRSEHDRNAKAFAEQKSKFEAVLKAAKENPDEVLRTVGHDPDAYAEAKLAARVRAAMREQEEKDDPSKKTARERDEELEALRAKVAEADKFKADAARQQTLGKVKGFVDRVVASMPEEVREFATPDVISIVRRALHEGKDIKVEDAAKAAQQLIVQRLARARKLLPPEGQPAPGTQPKHPAAAGKPRSAQPAKPNGSATPGAGDFLMDLQWGNKRN